MAEDDVAHEQIAQQRRANLAGESAALFPIHVLRTELDVLACYRSASLTLASAVKGGTMTISTS